MKQIWLAYPTRLALVALRDTVPVSSSVTCQLVCYTNLDLHQGLLQCERYSLQGNISRTRLEADGAATNQYIVRKYVWLFSRHVSWGIANDTLGAELHMNAHALSSMKIQGNSLPQENSQVVGEISSKKTTVRLD